MTALKNLEPIIQQMQACHKKYTTFKFTFNQINCDVIFDIAKSENYEITLVKTSENNFDTFSFTVYNPSLKVFIDLKGIKNFFNIPYGKTFFDINNFLNKLNQSIPKKLNSSESEARTLVAKINNVPDSHKIYYKDLKNWEQSNSGNHRTNKNLQKVKILLPDLYEKIKDKDISVNFTAEPNSKEQEKYNFDLDNNIFE